MRKFQKEQLLDIFKSLHELHLENRTKLEKKEYQAVQTALSDCQEAAIQMGEAIEQLVGEGTEAVAFLEQYCEKVYQTTVQLEELSAQKFYKNLEEVLIKAENAVKHISARKEIVFFPYKASMWDSLESIYLAAKEDENCDVYCVPIPYYDRRADGSLGVMHYEGEEYPKNIEVIDYRTYHLEKRCPDVIYIHNPYDEWNHVTCVPERYFARNLRNYTDQLVYIPYFVLDEIEPDDQSRIDGMKHFCFTPGVIYAHKVIVQSEKMRQIYINEYIKAAKESGLTGEHINRKYLEKKILGLGSPKFDKVMDIRKEDLVIPEEWLKIIKKPDGSWKKIVFYNTSINGLLHHDATMLEKMKDVFRVFKKFRNEAVLLWRPHPLIKTTIASMRPQLWGKYIELVEQYCNEGWGIYDDTADMDRAVALSDAYYGDYSSVAYLYRKTEKPVMIQNISVVNESLWECEDNKKVKIEIEDAVLDGDKIWFSAQDFNSLFSMDLHTKKTEFVGRFPNEPYSGKRLYVSMKLIKKKIYFIPFYAKSIAVYDIEKRMFSNIHIDETLIKCNLNAPLFMGVEEYKNYLFILPVFSKAIIRINLLNDELKYIQDWSMQVQEHIFNPNDGYFRRQSVINGDKLIVPFCNANAVLELNCDTLQSKIYELGSQQRGYSGIYYDGEKFWLSPRSSGNLASWNLETNTISYTDANQGEMENTPYAYVGVVNYKQRITMFSSKCFSFVKEENEEILFYRTDKGTLTIIDRNKKCKFEVPIVVNGIEVDIELLLKQGKSLLTESSSFNLQLLLLLIKKMKVKALQQKMNVGIGIHLIERES